MLIGIQSACMHASACKVQTCIFNEAFLKFTNSLWGKYVNQFWLPHEGRYLICGVDFSI